MEAVEHLKEYVEYRTGKTPDNIRELIQTFERYKKALEIIYNVDTMFIVGDSEREYNVQEAHDEMIEVAKEALYPKKGE